MYLARIPDSRRYRYVLRESIKKQGVYHHRDLFDLGENPSQFIIYPGGNAYYIDEVIEDQLEHLGVKTQGDELDSLFWPYVKPSIRRAVRVFRQRGRNRRGRARLSTLEKNKVHLRTHLFDKRRVHFLKTGRSDQRGLGRMPAGLLCWLQNKSRDEIEQGFMLEENILRPHELKTYIYVIFDLQQFFTTILAERAPEMLDRKALDSHFIEEICRLNQSVDFWGDPKHGAWLHAYLARYLIFYFDYEFTSGRFLQEELRAFINRHRAYRPPPAPSRVGVVEALSVLDITGEALEKMTLAVLTRLYRRLALKHHPDRGGDNETFIRITEAYHSLAKTKKVQA